LSHYVDDGLAEAKEWTEAFFSHEPESLLCLSSDDLSRLFKSAPTTDLLIDHSTTVLDLLMKTKSFDREGKNISFYDFCCELVCGMIIDVSKLHLNT